MAARRDWHPTQRVIGAEQPNFRPVQKSPPAGIKAIARHQQSRSGRCGLNFHRGVGQPDDLSGRGGRVCVLPGQGHWFFDKSRARRIVSATVGQPGRFDRLKNLLRCEIHSFRCEPRARHGLQILVDASLACFFNEAPPATVHE